jgi:zinc transporter, ZIP family
LYHIIEQFSPIHQALLATLFTWGVTAAGAALVFFTKTVKPSLSHAWAETAPFF